MENNEKIIRQIDGLTALVADMDEENLPALNEIGALLGGMADIRIAPGNIRELIQVTAGTVEQIKCGDITFELGYAFLCDSVDRIRREAEHINERAGTENIDPGDLMELETQLDVLAGLIADIEGSDPHVLGVIADLLEKIRNIPSVTEEISQKAREAAGVVEQIRSGDQTFENGFPVLREAVSRVQREVENQNRRAGIYSIMTPEDVTELETQLDVAKDLVAVLDEGSDHVMEVVGDLFVKISIIPSLPPELSQAANAVSKVVEQIGRGNDSSAFEAGYGVMTSAIEKLREELENQKSEMTEIREEGNAAASTDATDDGAEMSEFLEQQPLLLEALESRILEFEKGGPESLSDVLRHLRILREESGTFGMSEAEQFLKEVESCLEGIGTTPGKDAISTLLAAKDFLNDYFCVLANSGDAELERTRAETILASLRSGESENRIVHKKEIKEKTGTKPRKIKKHKTVPKVVVDPNRPEMAEFITEGREYLHDAEVALLALEKEPGNREHLDEIFRGFHNVKGIAGFLELADVQELAHSAESLLDNAREGRIAFSQSCASVTFEALDMLRDMINRVERALEGENYATPYGYTGILERLEAPDAIADSPEKKARETDITEDDGDMEAAVEMTPEAMHDTQSATTARTKVDSTVRVSTTRLDNLIDAVGELVITNAMVTQEPEIRNTNNRKLANNVSQLSKITRELQELATSMRMVSLKSTFQKTARIARDISVKSGAPIEFTYSGEDTEIDRNVVEEIGSPLVHMVRNAVDHGIEQPEERKRHGKPERGRIHLSAYHEGGDMVIKLSDDGRGLDRNEILAKAVKSGLVLPDAELSDHAIYKLIFQAGFSTAKRVTDVSGRGVGMDVVRKSVENLRGRTEIESRPGQGTTFTIRLPLTLAIIDGMVVTVGSERYIIPTIAISESLRPKLDQIKTVVSRGEMLTLRGELLPLFRLHYLFELEGAIEDPIEGLVVVIAGDGRKCALLVDRLIGQQQVVIKAIGKTFDHLEGISGGAITGDGRVVLILDAPGLVRLAHQVG